MPPLDDAKMPPLDDAIFQTILNGLLIAPGNNVLAYTQTQIRNRLEQLGLHNTFNAGDVLGQLLEQAIINSDPEAADKIIQAVTTSGGDTSLIRRLNSVGQAAGFIPNPETTPLDLTDAEKAQAVEQSARDRRRAFRTSLQERGLGAPFEAFAESKFGPLEAQFQLQQLLGAPETTFSDFLGTPQGEFGADVARGLGAISSGAETGTQGQFVDATEVMANWELLRNIGLQSRLQSVAPIFRSLVHSRQPGRDVAFALRSALGETQNPFAEFAKSGGAQDIQSLLNTILGMGAFQNPGEDPLAFQDRTAGLTPELQGFLSDIRGEPGQGEAFNIALQSRLQNTAPSLRGAVSRFAQNQFDRFLNERPGEAFLPFFARTGRFF